MTAMSLDPTLIILLVVVIGGAVIFTALELKGRSKLRQHVVDEDVEAFSKLPAGTVAYRVRGSDGAHLRSFYITPEQIILPNDQYDGKPVPITEVAKMTYSVRWIAFVTKDGTEYKLKHLHPAATNEEPIQYYSATYSIAGNDPDTLDQLIGKMQSYNIPCEKV